MTTRPEPAGPPAASIRRTHLDAQQTDEPEVPGRPDYLQTPVPGDHGACGPFADTAFSRGSQLPPAMHRPAVLVSAAAVLGGRAARRVGARR